MKILFYYISIHDSIVHYDDDDDFMYRSSKRIKRKFGNSHQ